jgi:hypothetical protein
VKVGLGHLILGLAVLGAACGLAADHIIAGSDAFTVIVGVGVAGGVLAGANSSSSSSTTTAVPPAPGPPAPPAG